MKEKQKKNAITGSTSEQTQEINKKLEEKVAKKVAEKQIENHEAPANHAIADKVEDTRPAKMKSSEISNNNSPTQLL